MTMKKAINGLNKIDNFTVLSYPIFRLDPRYLATRWVSGRYRKRNDNHRYSIAYFFLAEQMFTQSNTSRWFIVSFYVVYYTDPYQDKFRLRKSVIAG